MTLSKNCVTTVVNLCQILLLPVCANSSASTKTQAYTGTILTCFLATGDTTSKSHTVDCPISLNVHFRDWLLSQKFIQHRRLIYTGRVTEWYRNGVCLRACPTPTTLERSPPNASRWQKHAMTTKRPIHKVPYHRHLYPRGASPLFDVSEIDRTWVLLVTHVDWKYLLNFSAEFSRIHPISTTPLPVWIKIWVTWHESNSRPFMRYFRPNGRTLKSDEVSTQEPSSGLRDTPIPTELVEFLFDLLLGILRSNKRIIENPLKIYENGI